MNQTNIDKIVSLFTAMVDKTKADILPILNKESWDSIKEISVGIGKLTAVYEEFGKLLVTAKDLVVGKDGVFGPDDESALIKEMAIIANKKIDIPAIPEFVEQKVLDFLVNTGYRVAKEKFKTSPHLQAVYNAFAKQMLK